MNQKSFCLLNFGWSDCHAFQVGIYVTAVREMPFLCAIHALTPYARDVLSRLTSCASEETKDSVEHA